MLHREKGTAIELIVAKIAESSDNAVPLVNSNEGCSRYYVCLYRIMVMEGHNLCNTL